MVQKAQPNLTQSNIEDFGGERSELEVTPEVRKNC